MVEKWWICTICTISVLVRFPHSNVFGLVFVCGIGRRADVRDLVADENQ